MTVQAIVGMVADGMSSSEILKAYPDLEPEHIAQALRYAAYLTKAQESRQRRDIEQCVEEPRVTDIDLGGLQ